MIQQILPEGVHGVDVFGDRKDVDLFIEESFVIERSVEKRKNEFLSVRACARDALSIIGVSPLPILPGTQGEPIWPQGVVGSMTHCAGYRAAAVASKQVVAAIGIDAEPNAPLPDGILDIIAVSSETAHLATLPIDGVAWDRLLFCAKEAVYKAWYPLARRWLGFEDIVVTIDPMGGFMAQLLVSGPAVCSFEVSSFTGAWAVGRGLVVTSVVQGGLSQK